MIGNKFVGPHLGVKIIISKIMTQRVGPDLVSKYSVTPQNVIIAAKCILQFAAIITFCGVTYSSKGSFLYNLSNKIDTCSPKLITSLPFKCGL